MSVYLAEFIGTFLLVLLGDGVVANVILSKTKGNSAGWIVITVGWALAVFIPATMFGAASGAHFNPALTLGLAAIGSLSWNLVPGYILTQFAGAFVGAFFVWLMYKNHFDSTDDPGTQLGVFSTGPGIRSPALNLISEIIGTFVLVFAILGVGAASGGTWGVWAIICSIGISLGGTTGYAINPARDLGPRIAHAVLPIKGKGSSDWGYAWIPVVGPIIGALLGALLGNALF
ncbi:MAG: aquaporin family protein [Treponema sp.]|jgi:glycerol uptake facilitator protein|nr:aquaporin family protein [Treponema sp.]